MTFDTRWVHPREDQRSPIYAEAPPRGLWQCRPSLIGMHTSISRSGSAPIVIGGPGFDFVADQTFCYGRRTSSISSLVRFAGTLAAAVTLC